MGIMTNQGHGPDFNQENTPSARPAGAIWWARKQGDHCGCNGEVWGGEYGFSQGGDGYAAGGYGGGSTSAISALSYSSESTGDITSSLVSAKYDASGFENLNSPAYG